MEAIELSDVQLKEIHAIQFKLLEEVDRICRKFDIKYIISGGTLLGAVRNQQFIPWDDDIDVRMERKEYEKFCQVCREELEQENYFFQTYKTDEGYPWYYGKLRYRHSEYVRCGQEHLDMQSGIFIDIMPADGVPNDIKGQKRLSRRCYILKKFLYAVVGEKVEKNFFRRTGYCLMSKIPRRYIFGRLEALSKKYSSDEYEYVTCYSFTKWNQTEYTRRDWHLERQELFFEGKKFYAPKEYQKWLIMTYGEGYMELPPEEERVGHNAISKFTITY